MEIKLPFRSKATKSLKPRQLSPKSKIKSRTWQRRAQRPYKHIVTPKTLKDIRERNYTVSTVIDTVVSDRTKEGWIWVQENLGTDQMGNPIEASPEQVTKRDMAEKLLRRPNPKMTGKDYFAAINDDLETQADAFVEIVWGNLIDPATGGIVGRYPAQLWPIPAETVEILTCDDTGRLPDPETGTPAYRQVIDGTTKAEWLADEIIHIQANNQASRLYGRPKLISVILLIATQLEGINYNYKTFAGQKVPKQIVTIDTTVEDLERMLLEAEQEVDEDPHKVEFLAGKAASLLKLMESNRDMEFLQLIKYLERSICARWRLPPVAIGISEAGGAGIVVGEQQINKYWDMIEEGNEQIAEQHTLWFRETIGLTQFYLNFPIKRPEDELQKTQVNDMLIKANVKTINEVRAELGLDPVDWGSQPFSPMGASAAPAAFMMSPIQGQAAAWDQGRHPPLSLPSKETASSGSLKSVAPGRQDRGAVVQTDPVQDKDTLDFAGTLVGIFRKMRAELLELVSKPDIILSDAQTSQKAVGITQSQLLDEARIIASKYAGEMMEASTIHLLDSYLSGKAGAALDLQAELGFSQEDWDQLKALQDAWANTSISTFAQDQVKVIEDSLTQVSAAPSLSNFRALVEEAMGANLWREQYKLDRIARTSINRVSNHSRGVQFRDMAKESDPEVRWITAQDARVRPEHRALHGKPLKLSEALKVFDQSINCRCRIVRDPKQLPEGVPKPEDLVKDIKDKQKQAREEALLQFQEAS